METSPDREPLSQRYQDDLPAVGMGKPLIFGGLAALAGAIVWGLLIIYANVEHGIIAWGIGGAVGFAVVKGKGYGTPLAACAGVLALLAIVTGKNISYRAGMNEAAEEINQLHKTRSEHASMTAASKAWVALGTSPTDEAVFAFAENHGYDTEGGAAGFRANVGPLLESFATASPTLEEWRAQTHAEIASDFSFVDWLIEDFHPLDILFALLGIGTAFGLVQKETTALVTAAADARRRDRDEAAALAAHEAEQAAEPEPEANDGPQGSGDKFVS